MMHGIELSSLHSDLHRVSERYNQNPVFAIRNIKQKLGTDGLRIADDYFGPQFNFKENYYRLPLEALKGFSFDELCKLWHSSPVMMSNSVEKLFKEDAQYRLVWKIKNSMWRWGYDQGLWNEIVDAYASIRNFVLCDNPDFEIRLDYTTSCNEFGYSEFSRLYLDGVFAYLVYFKGKHVMTIGFSIMGNRRILIQQVQSAQRAGNRYLYKLPRNRLEFVIERFRQQFPLYELYLVEGESLTHKTLADLNRTLASARKNLEHSMANPTSDPAWIKLHQEQCIELEEHIHHLEEDQGRLTGFYANTGKFNLGQTNYQRYGLSHRILLPL